MASDIHRRRQPSLIRPFDIVSAFGPFLVFLFLVSPATAQTKSGSYLAIVRWTHVNPSEGGTSTCIIVGTDGQYHMESTPEMKKSSKEKDKDKKLRVSTGYLPDEYFDQFKKLVEARELLDIGSTPTPRELVWEKETDAIVLSIHRTNGSQDVGFPNADGKHPAPPAVSAFLPWVRAVRNLDDMLIKDPESNLCHALEPTADFLPQMIRR
jgi:hypothetical protein